ncbi:SETMAR [Cordylochernes scorpioides]|uniref:SETMAR n=1 Tax=Cordylochernes scorpioides TaxID=51811 RepID=A0ABY6L6E8_9ARAC|nr:SETMAR [Cordylochernes scorpioides]
MKSGSITIIQNVGQRMNTLAEDHVVYLVGPAKVAIMSCYNRTKGSQGSTNVSFKSKSCHVAGVKNSIPVWGRTESGYICGKEKPWEVASRDDPARRCQESLTSGQPTRRRKLMRVIVVYYDPALVDRTCQKWFARFKSSNFDLGDKERPRALLKLEGEKLEARLDEDATQTQKILTKHLESLNQPFYFA